MSMINVFVPSMDKSLFGKRLTNAYSVSVDDVPDGVCDFPNFMKETEW